MSRSVHRRLRWAEPPSFLPPMSLARVPLPNQRADRYEVCPLRLLISLRVYSGSSERRKLMTLWWESRRRNPSARPKSLWLIGALRGHSSLWILETGSPPRRGPSCDGLRSKLIKPITASILLSSTINGSPFITDSPFSNNQYLDDEFPWPLLTKYIFNIWVHVLTGRQYRLITSINLIVYTVH